jgi:thioredoxin-dependent peroxiredoxin
MNVGDLVDDFELPDEQGVQRTLSALLESGPVVLFFYPAAFTRGCTAEACHFRDVASEFAAAGAQPVGISGDTVEKQAAFSGKYSFGYPLLSDTDGTVRKQFGVLRSIALAPTKRTTFVIGTDRRVLEVIRNEVRMNVHADRALEAVRKQAT